MKLLEIVKTGIMDYEKSLGLQYELHEKRVCDKITDTLVITEHPHVFTMGRRASDSDFKIPKNEIGKTGIKIKNIKRGGEITYHGPGQLVFYIICRIENRGIKEFVHKLEEVSIKFLSDNYNIKAVRHEKHRGAWIGRKKIAAIGLEIKKNVTMHGFSININTDLKYYDLIVPCGITDMGVTSLKEITGHKADMDKTAGLIKDSFCKVFGYKL